MHQQIAQRHLARDPRVVHLEAGNEIRDAIVPLSLPASTSVASAAVVIALPVEPVMKMVVGIDLSALPSLRTPKPRESVTAPFSTMAIAMPGTSAAVRNRFDRAGSKLRGRRRPAGERRNDQHESKRFFHGVTHSD
jgi:hypothetical protein